MNETYKSGEWRICSACLARIAPKDRIGYLFDEVACLDCHNGNVVLDDSELEH